MPFAARVLDATSHPGMIGAPCAATVFINEFPAARVDDPHICAFPPPTGPHPPNKIAGGSTSVMIENKPAARQGDLTGCGASILGGSPDVEIGG